MSCIAAPFAATVSGAFAAPALAQAGGSANNKTLIALETKFFEHTYPTDSDDDRIARLEKLIFGETKSGDASSRLADIQKIVTSNDSGSSSRFGRDRPVRPVRLVRPLRRAAAHQQALRDHLHRPILLNLLVRAIQPVCQWAAIRV